MSIVHNTVILFCIGFSIINVIGIVINISIKIKLILGLIMGGICCVASPLLWKRKKINREKNIYNKITKKKKIKLREYGKEKKGDITDGQNNKDEIIKSNSLSSMRKRKSYNNVEEEESISSKDSENKSNSSDEQTTTSGSNDSYTDTNSENTLSEKKSDDDSDYWSFDRKFSRDELYNSIEKIGNIIKIIN